MKQHISVEQLLELKPAGLAKLFNLDTQQMKKIVNSKETSSAQRELNDLAFGVTIGTMMDVFYKNNKFIQVTIHNSSPLRVLISVESNDLTMFSPLEDKGAELCDVLWIAVKEFLGGRAILD